MEAPAGRQATRAKLMHWVRGHRRLGASLALLGLTLQLAFSLGHFHARDIAGQPASAIAAASGAEAHDSAPPPANHDHDHEDEYCAIYAFTTLIGSAHSADPPVLLFPQPLAGERFPAWRAFRIARPAHVISQARAPPTA